MHLNKHYAHIFPNGININFVHIPVEDHVLEYRCFERGINKETLACGTGALAVSFVARRMNMISAKQINVWPHRSRWYDPEAFILIDQDRDQWSLCGNPVKLLEGKFMMDKFLSEKVAAVKSQNSDHGESRHLQEEIPYNATSINC